MVCSTRAVCVWSYIVHSDLETTLIWDVTATS
jgi:hypothetical protein